MDGRTFLSQAKKAESSAGGGWFNFNKQEKLEDAAELYQKAGVAFVAGGQLADAGTAYEKAAALFDQAGDPASAARNRVECFTALSNSEYWDRAIPGLNQAVEHYATTDITRAANTKQKLAELLERRANVGAGCWQGVLTHDPNLVAGARAEWEQAGAWYERAGSKAFKKKSFVRDAELSAWLGDYARAYNTFEGISREYKMDPGTTWSIRTYLTLAGLCRLAEGDIITCKRAIPGFQEIEMSWDQRSDERNFLIGILEAIDEQDLEKFDANAMRYERFHSGSEDKKLQGWLVRLIREKNITEAGDDLT